MSSSELFKDILRRHAEREVASPEHIEEAQEPQDDAFAMMEAAAEHPAMEPVEGVEEDEDSRMAAAFEAAGLVTPTQRTKVEARMQELKEEGQGEQFRELAVQMGYCNRVSVAELLHELRNKELLQDEYVPNEKFRPITKEEAAHLIGGHMIIAGLITRMQRDKIVERQQKLAIQGTQIQFGDLAVELGFCDRGALDHFIAESEEDTSDETVG